MATKRSLDINDTKEKNSTESQAKISKITALSPKEDIAISKQSCSKTIEPPIETKTDTKEPDKKDNKKDADILDANIINIGKNETSTYRYVDTKEKFNVALKELNEKIHKRQMIALDCEGVDLSRFGSITMINIGTRDLVYLIDVLKIGNIVFDDGLRSILEDSEIEKLMFDCREDADALLHLHKTKLDGILDVQILEASNRVYRKGYTKVRSLKHCLELNIADDTLLNIKLQGRASMCSSSNVWEKRPLDENMLKYASVDILALFKLYDKLSSRMSRDNWKAASSRYCETTRSRNRIYRDDSGILPNGVIV